MLFDVVATESVDLSALHVDDRFEIGIELHRGVLQLVVEERAALLDRDGLVLAERLVQDDYEVELRELAIEVRRLPALPEDQPAVDIGLPGPEPRERDPRVADLLVELVDQVVEHQVEPAADRALA